ncbi:LysR substrate binding domain protein [compost metagenome]
MADLHHHRLIHYVKNLGSRSPGFEYLQAGALQVQPMVGSITVNSTEAYESACVAGLGLIQAPAAGLQAYLQSGELVPLLADFVPPPMPVSLLYARQQHVPPRLRAFIDWLAALLEPRLDPVAGGS